VWDTSVAPGDDALTPRLGHEPDAAVSDHGLIPEAPHRRWQWLVVAVGVVVALSVAVWSLGGVSDTGDTATDDETPASSAELDTLPDPDDTTGDTGSEDEDDEERGRENDEENGEDPPAVAVDDGTGSDVAASTTVDLPPAVAAIDEPTEVVALTANGELHTLSLPSGTLRTVTLGSANGGASLAVSPDASLIAPYQGGATVLVPRSGPPIPIDRDEFAVDGDSDPLSINGYGWVRDGDDSTAILAIGYVNQTDTRRFYVIRDDGTVDVDPTSFAISNFSFLLASPGTRIANDAGGVYRIDATGSSTRISDGHAVAGSEALALIRECDEERRCEYVLRSLDGPDSRPLPIDDAAAIDDVRFGATLSPDGSALAYTEFAGEQVQVLLDLATGEVVRSDGIQSTFDGAPAWARDGSGLFVITGSQGGLGFLDRASGEVTTFGDGLGQVVSVGVRYPDTELVERPLSVADIAFSSTPAAEIGLDVVTVGRLGSMTHVDLDDSTSASWSTPGVPGNPPPRLFADDGRVLAVSGNGSQAYVSDFGTATELDADAVFDPPYLPGPGDGTVWVRSETAVIDLDFRQVGLDGEPRNEWVRVSVDDATVLGGDSAGGVIMETGGDVYVSAGGDPGGFNTGLNRLTTGELLAVGSGHALVRECDTTLQCTTRHLDRATGEPTETDVQPLIGADPVDQDRNVSTIGSMSPDGEVALARFTTIGAGEDPPSVVETWALVDLGSGVRTPVMEPERDQPMLWNDDSSYAVFASDGRMFLYERSTSSIITVTGVSDVRAFTDVDESFDAPADDPEQG